MAITCSLLLLPLFYLIVHFSIVVTADGAQLILVNNCVENVWPGIQGSAGQENPKYGGFHLGIGEEVVFEVPEKWSGRIWGRQDCSFDSDGKGLCATGDCFGKLQCDGKGGEPPRQWWK
ncbi:hypothetical protein K1719_045311 [Acacia pycnantha]|nr:hypothetical protein K1719_045311 [Acacia pycnantha]